MPKTLYEIQEEERRHRAGAKMIRDHKRATRKQKPQSYPVHDACNTVFLCTTPECGEAAVRNYIHTHKKYW